MPKEKFAKHIWPILILAFLFNAGCNKDENNPTEENITYTKGSDYMPETNGDFESVLITGSFTEYDEYGNITNRIATSKEEYNIIYLPTIVKNNIVGNPVYYEDHYGIKLFGYLSSNNDAIIGIDTLTKFQAVLLPSELTIGMEWIPNSQRPLKEQVNLKLLEFLGSYTNSSGNTYKNVIKISFNHSSSNSGKSLEINGIVYLAKGQGSVELILSNYEEIILSPYKRTQVLGNAGLKN